MQQSWLDAVIAKNPSLKYTVQAGSGSNKSNVLSISKQPKPDSSRKMKYRNEKVFLFEDGFAGEKKTDLHGSIVSVFDSKKEFMRYNELLFLRNKNIISNLSCQQELLIQEGFRYQDERIHKITYRADFMYELNGKVIVEDVKPFDAKTQKFRLTEAFKIKWKLLKNRYPEIDFRLV